ncbi:hypothetical protein WAI453_007585 [Rhynchosporium graminicola]
MSSSTGTPSATTSKAGRDSASSLEPSPASTYGGSASSNAGDDDYPPTPGDVSTLHFCSRTPLLPLLSKHYFTPSLHISYTKLFPVDLHVSLLSLVAAFDASILSSRKVSSGLILRRTTSTFLDLSPSQDWGQASPSWLLIPTIIITWADTSLLQHLFYLSSTHPGLLHPIPRFFLPLPAFVDVPRFEGVMLSKLSKLSVNDGKDTGRYSPPFVRNGSQNKVEDPFTSPQNRSSQRTPTGPKHKGRSSKSGNWRSGSSSGSGSGNGSPTTTRTARGGQGVFAKEYVNENGELTTAEQLFIKPEDAQAIFPPSSCVFVANLLQSEGDEALEVAVTQIFREYGTVYVKIRRDTKHMPFAFCQYTNDADAERAIKEGRGRLIKGRPCRCEKAKAHRLFFFERKYGEDITPSEVMNLLRPFGRISFCRRITDLERACYDINGGVLVQFEMYDEGQAAQQAFRNHSEYKMQCMANMNSRSPAKSNPADRTYLDTYEVDKRSIFIGNLSTDVTEDELREIFSPFGPIVHISLHKADSTIDVNQKHCFAFIEFEQQPSVRQALTSMQGYVIYERSIRVAQKDTEAAKNRTRRQPSRIALSSSFMQSPAIYRSPAARVSDMGQAPAMPPSPMAYMTQGYASPYGFAQGGQYYAGYPAATLPGQVQYYSPAGYSPSAFSGNYFAYTGSPTYNAGASSAATVSGSPTQSQFYYGGYSPYPSSAGYWPTSNPHVGQQPVSFYTIPSYAPPATVDVVVDQEDRSATPTPAGHPSAAETCLESE